jgi:hypothetical protein
MRPELRRQRLWRRTTAEPVYQADITMLPVAGGDPLHLTVAQAQLRCRAHQR